MNETLDNEMFSDIEVDNTFNVEDIHYDEPELYHAIISGSI